MAFFNKKNNEKDHDLHEMAQPTVGEVSPDIHRPETALPQQESEPQVRQPETFQPPESHEIPSPVEIAPSETTLESLRSALRKSKRPKAPQLPIVRDELTKQVEKIMEEGLVDAFKKMTPIQQQQFKMKGEETATQIRELLKQTRIKIKKIFSLLLDWLKLLPGVNKFFLEQEAKIKAERILRLKELYKQKTRN